MVKQQYYQNVQYVGVINPDLLKKKKKEASGILSNLGLKTTIK